MAQTIVLRRSAQTGKVPGTSSLNLGEIAINTYDGRVFFKKSGSIESIEHLVTTNAITTGSITLTKTGSFGELVVTQDANIGRDIFVTRDIVGNGDLDVLGSITASLTNGYILVGNGSNRTQLLATSSLVPGNIYITSSTSAPLTAYDNMIWYDSDTGKSYIRYNDGSSTQWVLQSDPTIDNGPTLLSLQEVTDVGYTTDNPIIITNITNATSSGSGALIISGGIGVGGDVWARKFYGDGSGLTGVSASYTEVDTLDSVLGRGNTSANSIVLTGTTNATSKGTGVFRVAGGIGVEKDIWADNLILTGTLTASLQSGYAWVGNGIGSASAVATSSFSTLLPSGILSSSNATFQSYTASVSSFTASSTSRFTNLESKSASVDVSLTNLNTYTASVSTSVFNINAYTAAVSTSILNHNISSGSQQAAISALSVSTGSINSFTASVSASLFTINLYTTSVSASILNHNISSGSQQAAISALNVSSGSLNSYTASTNVRLNNLESKSASVDVSITNHNLSSGSQQASIAALSISTGSLNTFSASTAVSVTNINSYTSSLKTAISVDSTNLTVFGDLTVQGTTTTLNTTELLIEDKILAIASGSTTSAQVNGGGFFISGANASILWDDAAQALDINKSVDIAGNLTLTGTVDGVDISSFYTNVNTTTASLLVETSNLELFTASANIKFTNLESKSASVDVSISNHNLSSGSQQASISALSVSTGSLNTFTASTAASLTNLNTYTASVSTSVFNINNFTASISTSVFNHNISSGSQQAAISALSISSGSVNTFTASAASRLTNLESESASVDVSLASLNASTASINSKTGSYATTGSNTFVANQIISGNLDLSGSFTSSLLKGYVWVGDANNRTTITPTSSFGGGGVVTYENTFDFNLEPFVGVIAYIESANLKNRVYANNADIVLQSSNIEFVRFTTGSTYISSSLTASLQQGYLWVGNADGKSVAFSTSSLVAGGSSFGTIAVAGQTDVVADTANDTLTLVAGTNITITTNAVGDSITINSTATGTGDTSQLNASTASLNSFTASAASRLTNLESKSASVDVSLTNLNAYTASVSTSVFNLNTYTTSVSTSVFNLNISSGSQQASISALSVSTSSLNVFTASIINSTTALSVSTGSLNTFTASTAASLTNLNSYTASVSTSVFNLNTYTASVSTSVFNHNISSGSQQAAISALSVSTGSLNVFTASAVSRLINLESKSASVDSSISALSVSTSSINSYTSSLKTAISVNGADLIVLGDLTVQGTTTTLNTTELLIEDKILAIASGSTTSAQANGAGFFISGANASILWDDTAQTLDINKSVDVAGNITLTGLVDGVDVSSFYTNVNLATASLASETTNLELFTASAASRLVNLESKSASVDISISNHNLSSGSQQASIAALSVSTGSLNTFTASAASRLTNLETESASVDVSLSAINVSTASLNSVTSSFVKLSGGNTISGLQIISGALDVSQSVSSSIPQGHVLVGNGLNRTVVVPTSSFGGSGQATDISALNVSTASLNTFTASADVRLDNLEIKSASLHISTAALSVSTASINSFTNSADVSLTNLELFSSSVNTKFDTIGTQSGSWGGSSGGSNPNNYIKGISIYDPTNAEDVTIMYTSASMTIQAVQAVLRGSAGQSVTISLHYDATRSNAGTAIVSAQAVTSTTTATAVTLTANTSVPANNFIWLETTATAGTVNELYVQFEYA